MVRNSAYNIYSQLEAILIKIILFINWCDKLTTASASSRRDETRSWCRRLKYIQVYLVNWVATFQYFVIAGNTIAAQFITICFFSTRRGGLHFPTSHNENAGKWENANFFYSPSLVSGNRGWRGLFTRYLSISTKQKGS